MGARIREVEIPATETARWTTDAAHLRRFGEELQLALMVARFDSDDDLIEFQLTECTVDLTDVAAPDPASPKVARETTPVTTARATGRSTCRCRCWRRCEG